MEMLTKRKATATQSKIAPMKKVLITVDYDATAQQVAEIGYSLAQAMHGEVTLLHVIPDMIKTRNESQHLKYRTKIHLHN